MKRHGLLVGIFFLLTAAISSAQVALVKKSLIGPEQSDHFINPWSAEYAQNTRTGETLMIWYESEANPNCALCSSINVMLVGRIVDGQGKSVGKEFTIAAKPQKDTDIFNCCYNDKVAYNPVTNEYLVTHSEGPIDGVEYKILAQRLAADGKLKGPQVDLTSRFSSRAPFDNKSINLKFNPVTGGYSQFSQRHSVPADTTTVGFYELITPKGSPAQPPGQTNWLWPFDFTFLPSGKMLMAAGWETNGGVDVDYRITIVDSLNQNAVANQNAETWTFIGRFSRSTLPGGPFINFLLPNSAIAYFTDYTNVKGQRINGDGTLNGSSFDAFNSPAKDTRLLVSTVAFAETPRGVVGMLIALDDEGFPKGSVSIWAQPLDRNGKPVGSSKKLISTSANERIESNKLFALPGKPGDTVARFVWYGLKIDISSNKALGSNSKVQKLDLGVRLP